ncbi:hypothetical protein QBC44DRAFT_115494 [Cladorrhinum sp. PSN332]|nr:hypothetical protein QBC44DRAFT_115494 [Cladorrhinum sp. PSN332]
MHYAMMYIYVCVCVFVCLYRQVHQTVCRNSVSFFSLGVFLRWKPPSFPGTYTGHVPPSPLKPWGRHGESTVRRQQRRNRQQT